MYKRIFKMLLSQGFGLVLNIVEKLLMVPLFVSSWGILRFGEWLLIRTIPNILLTSDVGISSHAGNKINHGCETNDFKGVGKVIYQAIIMMGAITAILMILAICQFEIDIQSLIGVISGSRTDFSVTVFLMILHATLILHSQLMCGVSRVGNNYPYFASLAQIARLLELIFVTVALFLKCGFIGISLCYVSARIIINTIMLVMLVKEIRAKNIVLQRVNNITEYKAFLTSSISYAAIPITQAVFMQGSAIIISMFFGPALLAITTIIRNVTRFLVMFSTVISKSIWSELTRLWASGEFKEFKRVLRNFSFLNAIVIALAFVILIVFYRQVLTWFNINEENVFYLYLIILIHSALLAMNYFFNIAIIATSKHGNYAKMITVMSFISLAIFSLLSFSTKNLVVSYFISFCLSELIILLALFFKFNMKLVK